MENMDYRFTEQEEAVFTIIESAICVATSITTTKGFECLFSYIAQHYCGDDAAATMKPFYFRSVKKTAKIAGAVVGGKLASTYASDITETLKGGYYGYKVAKGCYNSGSEPEVLDE